VNVIVAPSRLKNVPSIQFKNLDIFDGI